MGSLLGARWLTLPAYWIENGFDAGELVNISGNYSILGGFAGGIAVGVWRARQLGLRLGPAVDVAAFGLAIGTVVGRIGDLAIVEHLGGPTSFVLECSAPTVGEFCGIYHHAALYDLLAAAVCFGFLYWLVNRTEVALRYGQLFAVWMTWYGLQRFLIDFTRLALDVGGDRTLGALTWSQWSGLAAAVGGVALFLWLGRRSPVVTPENDHAYGAVTKGSGT